MSNKFVVIDLETTGNNPKKGDRIIQFAAVVIENGEIIDKYSTLINPEKAIPAFIEELTGIDDEMVRSAPLFSEINEKVIELLEGAYFVAHNVLFDLSFLQEELIQSGVGGFFGPVLDTVEMARVLYPTADGYKLSDLAEKENLSHDRPHQADSDAQVTAELFLLLMERLEQLPLLTLKQLLPLSGGLKSDFQLLLDEMVIDRGADEKSTSIIEIFQGLALKQRPTKPGEDVNSPFSYPVTEDQKKSLMEKGIPSFEMRTGQFEMMDTVYNCFHNSQHALIEAGTGVGKSLGYLLPCAFFSKKNKVPIVISTHTIQLQEQILHKEIPLLARMIPFTVNAVLLKGRDHYISLYKFYQSLAEEEDNYDTTLSKMQILVWLTETETGDKDELNLSSGGHIYWNKIKNEQSTFLKDKQWAEKDFYLSAKRKAQEADFVITNHSLLLSDLKGTGKVLPDYKFAILDEGHHLEKTASHFFGTTLDYLSTRLLLGQFGQYDQKQLFFFLEGLISQINEISKQLKSTSELNQLMADCFYEMDEFFKLMGLFVKRSVQATKPSYNRAKVRFSSKEGGKEKNALVHSAERFTFLLKDIHSAITDRLDWINIKMNRSFTNAEEIKLEALTNFIKELEDLRSAVKSCFIQESSDVKWIEMDLRSPQNVTTFIAQPAFVASSLDHLLFSSKKSVILTSATLTVNGSFYYMLKELGLDSSQTVQLSIRSPFDYKKQVQMLLPEDLPAINMVSLEEYVIAITEHIITIAEATKGRMLILFTAYDMLKKTYELIKESGFLEEYAIIAQGITSGSRTRLTRNFQRYDKAILLGTSSFWEGIDIPGEDLTCLVIVRLPFSPPDEPITEAKCQLIEHQGGNPFSDYSLPEAVLRFKQGFGRLIRTEKDKGVLVVFDKRVVTTKYGKAFLKSIPPVSVKKGDISTIVQQIHKWLS